MKNNTGRKPKIDSPEQQRKCLSCQLPECVNCVAQKGEKRRKKHLLNFFGRQMTIQEIADEVGTTYKKVYSWNRYGGESWVEEKAKKLGYNPKGA